MARGLTAKKSFNVSLTEQLVHEKIHAHHSAAQAALVRNLRSLHNAEDAMQDAIVKALQSWPATGIPKNIVAWLVTTGLNSFRDNHRRDARLEPLTERNAQDLSATLKIENGGPEDDVLRLIFMCCHPSIAIENQLALTLNLVMGFNLTEISNSLIVPVKTLEKRLSRAKRKISGAGINFQLPSASRLLGRLAPVQQVLYLIFNEGYYASSGVLINRALCRQAISLCRSLCRSFPNPENFGLLALMLFQDSRASARIDGNQRLVTLDLQDRSLWNKSQIQEADVLLKKSLRLRETGFYQLQAAIAGVHSWSKSAEETDWPQIVGLYQHLLRVRTSPVIALNYAVALLFAGDVSNARTIIESLETELSSYSPFYAAQAKLHELLNNEPQMRESLEKAASLSGSEQEAGHYRMQLEKQN